MVNLKKQIYKFANIFSLFTFIIILVVSFWVTNFVKKVDAAANITITSPTLAVDGKTITATLSGGSGAGYSPSSGITGITVNVNGTPYPVTSNAISGTTLTLNMAGEIGSSATITVTILSSSNLTDSGANTATGQTAVATTNNSSKVSITIPITDSAFAYGGPYTDGAGLASRNYRSLGTGSYASVDLKVSGATTYAIPVFPSGATNSAKYSIDGGTEITPTLLTTGWNYIIATTTDTGVHTITIKQLTSTLYLDRTNGVTITGPSTPTYSRPIGLETVSSALTPKGSSYIVDEGEWDSYPNGGYVGTLYAPYPLASLRLKATGPINLFMWLGGGFITYTVDGGADQYLNIPSESRLRWFNVYTPSDSAEHDVIITFNTSGASQVYQVAATTINTSSIARRPVLAAYGDSNTAGAGLTTRNGVADLTLSYQYKIAKQLGYSIVSRGIGFTTVAVAANNGTGLWDQVVTTKAGANTTTNITGTTHPRIWDVTRGNPTLILSFYGVNDMADNWYSANTANGHETPADLQTAYQAMETYLTNASNYPGGTSNLQKFLAISLHPRTDVTNSIRGTSTNPGTGTWNAAIKNANTAVGDSRFIYVPTEDLTAGGIHLNDAAMASLANITVPYATSTGYTLSGPSSGTSGQASTNFTVTIASGATFTGTQTVTISDSGNGGTFTPSVGSATTTGIVTVTPTNGATSFTFTYTPATPGTKTLTFTNGQGWTDPSAATYTAASPDSNAPTVSMTAPTNGSTVSGVSVAVSADASDDTGVSGVQFKLDTNTNIGSEDTSSPYGVTWDSTAVADGSHTFIAVARDAAGNYATSTAVTITVDNTAPVRSAGSPSGTLSYGTSATSISLTTNETATCKYSTSSGTAYGAMTGFSTTGGTSHTTSVSGLSDGNSYTYYVKCSDAQSNSNATDYSISFSIGTDTVAPVLSSISAGSLSMIGATITWATNEAATSQVQYGLTSSYTVSTTPDSTLTTNHSQSLSGLTANTTYHYSVISTDASGNTATSSDQTFTTTSVTSSSNSGSAPQTSSGGGYNPFIPTIPVPTPCTAGALFNTSTGQPCASITKTTPTAWLFTRDLQLRTVHPEVKLLQQYLNTNGYIVSTVGAGSAGRETTFFGSLTRAALIKFQKAKNILPSIGYFGPITRKFISEH